MLVELGLALRKKNCDIDENISTNTYTQRKGGLECNTISIYKLFTCTSLQRINNQTNLFGIYTDTQEIGTLLSSSW